MASSMTLIRLAQILSIGAAAWGAGSIASISLVTVPALQQSYILDNIPASTLAIQWQRIYNIGKARIPLVAGTGSIAFAYLAFMSQTNSSMISFVTAALLTVAIAPFTLIAMDGTNDKLKDHVRVLTDGDKGIKDASRDAEIEQLVEKWKYLNLGRSLFPSLAFLVGVVTTL